MFEVFFTRNRVIFFYCLLFSMLFSYETLACGKQDEIKLPHQVKIPTDTTFRGEKITISKNATNGRYRITFQAGNMPPSNVYYDGRGRCWFLEGNRCLKRQVFSGTRNSKDGVLVLDHQRKEIYVRSIGDSKRKTDDNKPYVYIKEEPLPSNRLRPKYKLTVRTYPNENGMPIDDYAIGSDVRAKCPIKLGS